MFNKTHRSFLIRSLVFLAVFFVSSLLFEGVSEATENLGIGSTDPFRQTSEEFLLPVDVSEATLNLGVGGSGTPGQTPGQFFGGLFDLTEFRQLGTLLSLGASGHAGMIADAFAADGGAGSAALAGVFRVEESLTSVTIAINPQDIFNWLASSFGVDPSDPGGNFTAILFSMLFRIIFPIGLLFGVIGLIVAGYTFMTSQGAPDKVKAGKEQLTSAIMGSVFIALSLGLLRFIIGTIF